MPQRSNNAVEARVGTHGFRTEITAGDHLLIADEPHALGGRDEGPTPYDLLASALASCIAMTLRWHADRRGWPLEGVCVRLTHGRVHETDCETCEEQSVGIHQFEREIELTGPLSEEQRAGLLRVADRCPVGQTLIGGIRIVAANPPPSGPAPAARSR
jgi:putative redox protein